jgi:AmmeMemoRadiSam system protein A
MKRNRWLLVACAILAALGGCQKAPESSAQSAPQGPIEQVADSSPQARPLRRVKEAAVAGLFYPQDKAALANTVDRLLAGVKPVEGDGRVKNLRGLVVPHAGYEYSGPVAAVGYKQVEGRSFSKVVVMAPSHTALFRGAYVSDVDAYRTPLGTVPVARGAAELAKRPPFSSRLDGRVRRPDWWRQSPQKAPAPGEDLPDTWEHSLEVQLPFLQRTLGEFTLVPIIFGDVDPKTAARELAGLIDSKTLVVASSDLSHFEPYETARKLDTSCTEAIVGLDVDRMEREDACGKFPILALMHVAREKGWKTKLLDYRNSGDTAGDKSRVVGYAAIAFYDEKAAEDAEAAPKAAYSPEERKFLLDLARKSLVEAAHRRKPPEVDPAQVGEKLKERRACFVTLTIQGNLRGCIGHILPQEALYRAVIDNAQSAALRDPRFKPVGPDELDRIDIEVSVLTVPAPLAYRSPEDLLAKLRPGVDGVVLEVGRAGATYLPQVWEQIPDKEAFMSSLAKKAGLPPNAWKDPRATVLVYQVEAFEESGKRKAESGGKAGGS